MRPVSTASTAPNSPVGEEAVSAPPSGEVPVQEEAVSAPPSGEVPGQEAAVDAAAGPVVDWLRLANDPEWVELKRLLVEGLYRLFATDSSVPTVQPSNPLPAPVPVVTSAVTSVVTTEDWGEAPRIPDTPETPSTPSTLSNPSTSSPVVRPAPVVYETISSGESDTSDTTAIFGTCEPTSSGRPSEPSVDTSRSIYTGY